MLRQGQDRPEAPPVEPTAGSLPGAEDGIAAEVRDVIAHIRRRRRAVVWGAVAFGLLGAVAATLLPRVYTATAQILVDPRGLRVFDNEVVPGGQISDVQSALVESQTRVLKSDSVLAPVVAQQHLAEDTEFNGEPHNIVARFLAGLKRAAGSGASPDPAAMALSQLSEAVKVQRVPNSFVLELSVGTRDAEKSARLAQAITEAFIAEAEQSRIESAKRVSEGLAMRLDALGGEVKRAETAVDTFKRDNNIVDTNGRPVNEQQLADLSNQLVSARVRTAELRSRVEQVQRALKSGGAPDATAENLQSNAITALRNRYAELQTQRDNLLTSLGPRHPSLIAATAQLNGVRQLIDREIGRVAASARADLERAAATQSALETAVTEATTQTGAVNTATIRLRELEREAAARRAVYESFLTRSRETREQGDLPTVNIAVISPASVPFKASGLPGALIIAVAAAFGASATALAVLGLDHLAGRILTTRQMTLVSGLPLLAVVRRRARSLLATVLRRPDPTATDVAPSTLRGLYRAVADTLPGRPPRIALLLSVTPAVAGVRVPLALAQAAAEDGERVLLIDANDDTLTRPFDKAGSPDSRGWTPIRSTGIPNLSVLAWSAPFVGATPSDGRGGAGALRHFAIDHDVILIHALRGDEQVRLRPLAAVATTVVLLMDADQAGLTQIDAIRNELGPEGAKAEGFVWVTGERRRDDATGLLSTPLGAAPPREAPKRAPAARIDAA